MEQKQSRLCNMVLAKPLSKTGCCAFPYFFFFFRNLGMIKCPTAGSHILHPNNGVFQAIVVLGTHPVYLNPSAHSAVKPWHEGSSTPILHPYIWQWVGSSGRDAANEINPECTRKKLHLMVSRYRTSDCCELCIYSFNWVKHLLLLLLFFFFRFCIACSIL